MRILHVTPYYYPAVKFGGPIQSVHSLNKYMVKKGIDIDVYTTNAGLNEKDKGLGIDWQNIDDVKIKYFNFIGYEHYNLSINLLFEILKNVKNYDLIHISFVWNFPALASYIACFLFAKPYVISPRGTLNKEAIEIKSRKKKELYYKLFAKHFLKKANSIHFTTEDEKDNVINHLKLNDNYFVVPNGLDFAEFQNLPNKNLFKNKYSILKNKRYLLFLGRINKKKGLDLLSRVFVKIIRTNKDLFLVIVGPDNDNYKKDVIKYLKENNAINNVIFPGFLNGTDKLEAYVDAEVFVLPSYSENFSMSVVEAMACKVPVVISNKVGIYSEILEENAGLITDNSENDLLDCLSKLLKNNQLRNDIAEKGQNFVKKYYDINNVANTMIMKYEEILGK